MSPFAPSPPQGPVHVGPAPEGFDDWPALLALLQQAFAYMDGRIDPPSSLQRLDAAGLRAKAAQEQLLLAWVPGAPPRLLGCAYAGVRTHSVYVGKLAVAEGARGLGLARRLMAAADDIARAHGRPWLELQTRVELVENHRTFEALGFVKVAETSHPGYARVTTIEMRRPVA